MSLRVSAKFASLDAQVHINAQSGPNGEDARGRFTLTQGALTVEGEISCLNVAGNAALAGGTIVSSNDPFWVVGRGFYQLTIDNGSPGTSDASQTFFLLAPPAACPAPGAGGFTLTSGNYTVHDAG